MSTTTVSVCGLVSTYTAATGSSPGSIAIGNRTLPIAAGAAIEGSSLIVVGANLCLTGTLNGLGQIVSPTSVVTQVTTEVSICGVVSAYTAATASTPGLITIGNQALPIAAGTVIEGSSLIGLGANLCLTGTVNAGGQLVAPTSVTTNVSASINVCGVVAAYTAATSFTSGTITIGGNTFPIATATVIAGSNLIAVGVDICLNGTVNAFGELIPPSTVTVNAGTSISVCGVVSAYTASMFGASGSITIAGQTFSISPSTTIDGAGLITVGANLCLNGTLNASGQLIPPSTVTVNTGNSINLCGVVTAYAAATAGTPGSITIAGQTFSIAPGTVLSGNIQVGADLCLGRHNESVGSDRRRPRDPQPEYSDDARKRVRTRYAIHPGHVVLARLDHDRGSDLLDRGRNAL